MTREKDFEKAAMDFCEDHSHCIYFEAGCEHGYQYAIDKACEWLEFNAHLYVDDIDQLHESALIGDFRKAMEE